MTSKSQVLCTPILIINFVLLSIDPVGNPARIVSEMMKGFIADDLHYHEIIFDVSSDELIKKHGCAMAQLVNLLER